MFMRNRVRGVEGERINLNDWKSRGISKDYYKEGEGAMRIERRMLYIAVYTFSSDSMIFGIIILW